MNRQIIREKQATNSKLKMKTSVSNDDLLVGGDFAVLTSFVTFLGQARKVKK